MAGLIIGYLLFNFQWFIKMNGSFTSSSKLWGSILLLKTIIETIASLFAAFYLAVALCYQRPKAANSTSVGISDRRRIAVAYFCCDDLDPLALTSIVNHCHEDCGYIFVHDDSITADEKIRVDNIADSINQRYQRKLITIVRREKRVGGKAGAINNLLARLPSEAEFLLSCDSDSYLYSSDTLRKSLSYSGFRSNKNRKAQKAYGYWAKI